MSRCVLVLSGAFATVPPMSKGTLTRLVFGISATYLAMRSSRPRLGPRSKDNRVKGYLIGLVEAHWQEPWRRRASCRRGSNRSVSDRWRRVSLALSVTGSFSSSVLVALYFTRHH